MTLNELNFFTSTFGMKKQTLTIDKTEFKFTGRCRIGLNSSSLKLLIEFLS